MSSAKLVTKTDLVGKVAENLGITKKASSEALESFLGEITDALERGYKVQFPGFGSWSSSIRSARIGRNPKTGEAIKIPESVLVKFSVGSKLKQSVNTPASKKKRK